MSSAKREDLLDQSELSLLHARLGGLSGRQQSTSLSRVSCYLGSEPADSLLFLSLTFVPLFPTQVFHQVFHSSRFLPQLLTEKMPKSSSILATRGTRQPPPPPPKLLVWTYHSAAKNSPHQIKHMTVSEELTAKELCYCVF